MGRRGLWGEASRAPRGGRIGIVGLIGLTGLEQPTASSEPVMRDLVGNFAAFLGRLGASLKASCAACTV
eukprot:8989072-Pyramimonas_sp.AAC.1